MSSILSESSNLCFLVALIQVFLSCHEELVLLRSLYSLLNATKIVPQGQRNTKESLKGSIIKGKKWGEKKEREQIIHSNSL